MLRRLSPMVIVALLSPAMAAAPDGGPMTCAAPVAPGETLQSLKSRFGADAAIEDLAGAEGATVKGLVLYPHAPDKRVEVGFGEEGAAGPKSKATGFSLHGDAPKSRWTIAGLTLGSTVADVQKANGKPFVISGFGWDYGGYALDFKGGELGKALPGGCTLSVRFSGENAPAKLSGDGVKISSDNPALLKWRPTVSDIGLSFPEK